MKKKKPGKKRIPFDWEKFDSILQFKPPKQVCSDIMGVSEDVIERRIKEKFECTKLISSDEVIEKIVDHCTNNLVKTHSLFHFPFLNEWSWNTDKNSVYNVCIRGINGKSILSNGHDGFLTLKIYDLTTNLLYDEKPNIFNNYTYWSAIDFIPLMSRFIQEGLRVQVWNGKEKVTEKNILREHPYRFFSNKSYISFDDDKLILEYPSDRHLLNRVYGEITDSLLHSYRWAHQNQGFTNVLPMSGDVIVDFSGGVGISSIWYNYYNPSKVFLYEKDNDMREILYNNVSTGVKYFLLFVFK